MKLLHDFGVSALALTIVLSIMGAGGIILVLKGYQEFALAWVGAMLPPAKMFFDGYISYRTNGAKPPDPGSKGDE